MGFLLKEIRYLEKEFNKSPPADPVIEFVL